MIVKTEKFNKSSVPGLNVQDLAVERKLKRNFYFSRLTIILVFIIILILPKQSNAQIHAGSGYLKILPGARQIGMAGTSTGALDYTYALYTNPGTVGFMREWLWSGTYANWISDIYNTSFLFGRKIRMPWSRQTRYVLGINYLGIPEFDSSNKTNLSVSGNNLLVTAGIGQPLSFITPNLSFGTNVKYFSSNLAGYDANCWIFDTGLLFRTVRFPFVKSGNGFFDYAIFSAGIAVTNLGNSIKFISEETPLPRTFRAGIAFNAGTHHGFQFNIATDFRKVRDEDSFITFGSELSWNQLVSLRLGYSFEDNLLGNFTFGGSLRLNDYTIKSLIPGRNNGLRFDIAANQNSTFNSSPYHGSITHHAIGPENFNFIGPLFNTRIHKDTVTLAWETTIDPDLFDDINYWLLLDQDSLKLAQVHEIADRNINRLFDFLNNEIFLANHKLDQAQFLLGDLSAGDYFWSVFAFDNDKHIRFAKFDHRTISKFHVTTPHPVIAAINFEYYPWITEDDYQGLLKITIKNIGERTAKNFTLFIYDSMTVQLASKRTKTLPETIANRLISQKLIPEISSGDSVTMELQWRTNQPGLHYITAEVTKTNPTSEKIKVINKQCSDFYTIPKGTFFTNDTIVVLKQTNILYELPYIGKVFFDSSSTKINKKFIKKWVMTPPLATFVRRLIENPTLKVSLQGTSDPNSNEYDVKLANERAIAVRDSLYKLGVGFDQVNILPGIILSVRKLPKNNIDALWILQGRRRVDIIIDESWEEKLFGPLQKYYSETFESLVTFKAIITGIVPLQEGIILLKSNDLKDTLDIKNELCGASLVKNISWQLQKIDQRNRSDWLDKDAVYSIVLTDTLGRKFRKKPQNVFLKTITIEPRHLYFVLAEFGQAKPFYNFYWSNLLDKVPFLLDDPKKRMRFIGHGCAIGPEHINERLSKQRARVFHQKFLTDVKKRYPDLYDQIKQKIDPPEGLGESEPLILKSLDGETILLGDNSTPLGRQLNRRVMVMFYTER